FRTRGSERIGEKERMSSEGREDMAPIILDAPGCQKMRRSPGTLSAAAETAKLATSVTRYVAMSAGSDLSMPTAGTFSRMTSSTTKWNRNTPNEALDRVTMNDAARGAGRRPSVRDRARVKTASDSAA